MASTFTALGVELQAAGENAGTWGDKTNANLNLISQLFAGYNSQSIAGGAQTTALTVVDGNTTGTAQHRMIEFTGTIANQIVTIPLDVEAVYLLRNSTSGLTLFNLNMCLVVVERLRFLLQIKEIN